MIPIDSDRWDSQIELGEVWQPWWSRKLPGSYCPTSLPVAERVQCICASGILRNASIYYTRFLLLVRYAAPLRYIIATSIPITKILEISASRTDRYLHSLLMRTWLTRTVLLSLHAVLSISKWNQGMNRWPSSSKRLRLMMQPRNLSLQRSKVLNSVKSLTCPHSAYFLPIC